MRFFTSITHAVLLIFGLLASAVFINKTFAQGTASQAADKTAKAPIKILAFGDSLTAGYRLAQKLAWPSQLEADLNKKGHSVIVTNSGVSGDTAGQGLRRVDWILKKGPFAIVLLGLGSNDGMRNLPLKDLEKNLLALIDRFQAAGSEVVLLGMKLPTNQDAKYRTDFEAIYPRIAKEKKLTLYPFLLDGVAAKETMNLDDQIHPNALGHEKIAAAMAESFNALVSKHEHLAQPTQPPQSK